MERDHSSSNLNEAVTTPRFLIWAIDVDCHVKSSLECTSDSPTDLLILERTFRPLRSIALATTEDRKIDDLCIMQGRREPPEKIELVKGFSATESLSAFGGAEFLNAHCGPCPANLYRGIQEKNGLTDENQFAGCYGYLLSEYDGWDLFGWLQSQLDEHAPRWNRRTGFQLDEVWRADDEKEERVLKTEDMELLNELVSSIPASRKPHSDWASFAKALQYAIEYRKNILLHVVPESKIVDRNWIVPQHCSSCIHAISRWMGHCPHCGTKQAPVSMRKRQLRGDRPYWPITRFLGVSGAEQIAEKYFDTGIYSQESANE